MATSTFPFPLRKRPRAPTLEFSDPISPIPQPSTFKRPRNTALLIQELPISATTPTLPSTSALPHPLSPQSPTPPLLSPSISISSTHSYLSPSTSATSASSSSSSSSNESDTDESESTLQNDDGESSDEGDSVASASSSSSSSSSSSDDADSRPQSTANDSRFTQFNLTQMPVLPPYPCSSGQRRNWVESQRAAASSLGGRLRDFLPALAAANQDLEVERREGRLEERDIERVDEGEGGQYIEMDLGLGVLEERVHGEGSSEGEEESGSDGDGEDGMGKEPDVLGRLLGRGKRKEKEKPGIEVMDEMA